MWDSACRAAATASTQQRLAALKQPHELRLKLIMEVKFLLCNAYTITAAGSQSCKSPLIAISFATVPDGGHEVTKYISVQYRLCGDLNANIVLSGCPTR